MPDEENLIDKLMAEYNDGDQKKPRSRKGNNPARKGEKKASKDIPAIVDEGTRIWRIAQEIKHGKSLHEISVDQKLDEKEMKAMLNRSLLSVYDEVAPVFLNYIWITMARLEETMGKLWDKMFDDQGNPNDTVIARYQSLARQQRELIEMANPKGGKGSQTPAFNETLLGDSPLYDEGKSAMSQTYRDEQVAREDSIGDLDNAFGADAIIIQPTRK